ncbi:unnamed protein product [Urochloa humidicola]
MSPLSYSYAPLRADAAAANVDGDDTSTSPPETLTVSTVAAAAVGVGHHLFKVKGYSRFKHTHGDNGSCLESGEFTAGGHAWRVHCCLNGNREECAAGHVSLHLKRSGGSAAGVVHAEFEFELLPHGAAEWPSSRTARRSPVVPFKAAGIQWGYAKFITVKDLERSRFLRDDCFAVRCTVTVVEEREAVEEDVTVEDMDRVGVVCACKDVACRFKHERPVQTLSEVMARFSRLICGEASS